MTCRAVCRTLKELSWREFRSKFICSEEDNLPLSWVMTSLTLLREDGNGGNALISAVRQARWLMMMLSNTWTAATDTEPPSCTESKSVTTTCTTIISRTKQEIERGLQTGAVSGHAKTPFTAPELHLISNAEFTRIYSRSAEPQA